MITGLFGGSNDDPRILRGATHISPWEAAMILHRWMLKDSRLPSPRDAGSMGHRSFAVVQVLLALWLLGACTSPPERALSLHAPLYATLPNGYEPLNPTQPASIYAEVMAVPGDNLIRYLERKRGQALNILSLSGGGQNGAFGAGPAKRLARKRTAARVRSSSAVLAPVHCWRPTRFSAPLPTMRSSKRCTRKSPRKDIYNERGIFSLAIGADSLSDTAPLQALIVKYHYTQRL